MNTDEDYGFDVSGYLHLRQVVDPQQVAAALDALDGGGAPAALEALRAHAVLREYLEALCGEGFVADTGLTPVDDAPGTAPKMFAKGADDQRRLRYHHHGGVRLCHGVRVVWALAPAEPEAGALVLVPASHRRSQAPPPALLDGDVDPELTVEPDLAAGDVVLCAATLVHGVRGRPGRLLEGTFLSARAMPAAGFEAAPSPPWTADLSAAQRLVVGPRTTGARGRVTTDGDRLQVDDAAPAQHQTPKDPWAEERWFWDVRGYLVLRGVMDADWLQAANAAVDAALALQDELPEGHPSRIEEVPEQALRENGWQWPADTSPRLRGDIHRPRIGGLYELPDPHGAAFRRMIGHPAIVRRLTWMLGPGFKESTEPMCCVYPTGTTGGSLHGQNPGGYYAVEGQLLVEQVNVAWALRDEAPGFGDDSGGFVCVPGSHRANYPIPRPLTTGLDLEPVHKPALKAGDVLMFGALAHGTTAWRSPWPRRTAIQFMSSENVATRPANPVVGWRWSSDPNNPANRRAAAG